MRSAYQRLLEKFAEPMTLGGLKVPAVTNKANPLNPAQLPQQQREVNEKLVCLLNNYEVG
jgi:hypothetical protein